MAREEAGDDDDDDDNDGDSVSLPLLLFSILTMMSSRVSYSTVSKTPIRPTPPVPAFVTNMDPAYRCPSTVTLDGVDLHLLERLEGKKKRKNAIVRLIIVVSVICYRQELLVQYNMQLIKVPRMIFFQEQNAYHS